MKLTDHTTRITANDQPEDSSSTSLEDYVDDEFGDWGTFSEHLGCPSDGTGMSEEEHGIDGARGALNIYLEQFEDVQKSPAEWSQLFNTPEGKRTVLHEVSQILRGHGMSPRHYIWSDTPEETYQLLNSDLKQYPQLQAALRDDPDYEEKRFNTNPRSQKQFLLAVDRDPQSNITGLEFDLSSDTTLFADPQGKSWAQGLDQVLKSLQHRRKS
jgi:hypothetical protein